MRKWMVASLMLLAGGFLPDAAVGQGDPEKRLLEAELLEVGKGELDSAMACYQELRADTSAPEAVRARALFGLARCERKRGQLAEAEKLLDELIRTYPGQADLVGTARSFLAELRTGKPADSAFDWIGALERNPEIQSRVFTLAMQLANPESDEGRLAKKQLLAIGRLAVPVLERVLAVSRDPFHRQQVAVILFQAGQLERLADIYGRAARIPDLRYFSFDDDILALIARLDSDGRNHLLAAARDLDADPRFVGDVNLICVLCGDLSDLAGKLASIEAASESIISIRSLHADGKEQLLAAAREIKVESHLAGHVNLIRVLCGDLSDLAEKLKSIEAINQQDSALNAIGEAVIADPSIPRELALRLRDPSCANSDKLRYIRILEDRVLDLLEHEELGELLGAFLGPVTSDRSTVTDLGERLLRRLEDTEDWDALAGILSRKEWRDWTNRYFVERYYRQPDGPPPPAGWARAFRKAADHDQLFNVARTRDVFLAELGDFLRNRQSEAPDFGVQLEVRTFDSWIPSPAYAATMASLLDVEDPITLSIALEGLAFAPRGVGPEVLDRLVALLASTEDLHLRELLLFTITRRFADRPETGPAVARAWADDHAKWAEVEIPRAYFTSPLAAAHQRGRIFIGYSYSVDEEATPPVEKQTMMRAAHRGGPVSKVQTRPFRPYDDPPIGWIFREVGQATLARLLPHVIEHAGTPSGRELLTVFNDHTFDAILGAVAIQYEGDDPRILGALVQCLQGSLEHSAQGLRILRHVATDPKAAPDDRSRAFGCGPSNDKLKWFDWPALLSQPDPVVEGFVDCLANEGGRSPKQRLDSICQASGASEGAILRAMLKSPYSSVRRVAIEWLFLPWPEARPILEKALADEDKEVKGQALRKLIALREAGTAPLLAQVLAAPEHAQLRESNMKAIVDAIIPQASPVFIPPLVKLLDDRNTMVRAEALRGLREIKRALEERQEWQRFVEEMKRSAPPHEEGARKE